jgi:hypothetical protein
MNELEEKRRKMRAEQEEKEVGKASSVKQVEQNIRKLIV